VDAAAVQKRALRQRARALRADALADRGPTLAEAVAARFLSDVPRVAGAVVAGYVALPGELDPAPLLAALHDRGHPIALPLVEARGLPLRFHRWAPGDALRDGVFSVREPLPSAPEAVPALVIVPLLLWDRRGHRLGYGGGYYDRTLAALPEAQTVGYSLAALEVEQLPTERWDVPLGAIVTEDGVHRPGVVLTPRG
jgi:5-formyltetrahydrofolate cyclo-ligase